MSPRNVATGPHLDIRETEPRRSAGAPDVISELRVQAAASASRLRQLRAVTRYFLAPWDVRRRDAFGTNPRAMLGDLFV